MEQKEKTGRYMRQLAQAACWQMTPEEARMMLNDYEELLAHSSYSEDEMPREIGDPWQAVRLLADPRHYRRWLLFFALLSACILLPAVSPLFGMYELWDFFTGTAPFLPDALFLLGLVLSFFWFQKTGARRAERGLPKRILPLLLLLSAGCLAAWATIYVVLLHPEGLTRVIQQLENNSTLYYIPRPGQMLGTALTYLSLLCAGIGQYGLIQARLTDRRWRAVYALGLTASALCIAILTVLVSMNLDFSPGWQIPCLRKCILLTIAGLVGTGAALC